MTQAVATTYWSQIKGMAEEVPAAVKSAIASASANTGVNFSYLMAKAQQESGCNATAHSSSSSAAGLYQFVSQTWLGMVDKYGAKYGLGNLQKYISHASDGSLTVKDPTIKKQILALRDNPAIASDMAAELTRDNQEYLSQHTSGKIGPTELYLAHFLGAGNAAQFINAKAQSPGQSAAALFPDAAEANPTVFYSESGRPLSLQQIYSHFAGRFAGVKGSGATLVAGTGANAGTACASSPVIAPVEIQSAAIAAPVSTAAAAAAAQPQDYGFSISINDVTLASAKGQNAALWLAGLNQSQQRDDIMEPLLEIQGLSGTRKIKDNGDDTSEPVVYPNSAWLATALTSAGA